MEKAKIRALELYLNGARNKSEIARTVATELHIPYNERLRKNLHNYIAKHKNAIDPGIVNASETLEINPANVPYLWLKTKEASLFVRNPHFKVAEIDFDKVISECMEGRVKVKKIKTPKSELVDRLIWTDVHVAMDASRKGLALYPMDWNREVLMSRIDLMVDFVLANKTSDILIIDELGDYLDGWDGETTRKGHKLPQNMTNEEAFDCGVKAKMYLIDTLANHYKFITCNNICEDNHAGAFGYVCNSAVKSIVD